MNRLICSSDLVMDPNDQRWLSYISCHPDAAIFHHPAWIKLVTQAYHYRSFVFAICDQNGEILAGLPIAEIKNLLSGIRWVALPFTDHCAPLASEPGYADVLTCRMVEAAMQQKIQQVEIRSSVSGNVDFYPSNEFYYHKVKLVPDFSLVSADFSHMHKRNIRKAISNDLEIEWGKDLPHLHEFYSLHVETRRRQGVPVQPWYFFMSLKEKLLDNNLGSVLVVRKDHKAISAGIFLFWGKSMVYKYGASNKNALGYFPNNLMFNSAIQWGCEHGYRFLDMGRTDLNNQGLRDFKLGWGATGTILSYSSTRKPIRRDSNSYLSETMHYVIQHSPLWFCRFVGEVMYPLAG